MSKKVLVLFSKDSYDGRRKYANYARLLQRAGRDNKVAYRYGTLSELIFAYDGHRMSVTDPRNDRDVSAFDLVFFQKWMVAPQYALAVALYLRHTGTDFFSSEVLRQNPFSKLTEMVLLTQSGLPYPKTVIADQSALHELVSGDKLPFGFPFILKSIDGSRGSHNFKIDDKTAFDKVVQSPSLKNITLMAQEFIPNDYDYRLTFFGGELQYILQRFHNQDSHLNNISRGGKGEFVKQGDLPVAVIDDALAAARAVHREEFSGVDIVVARDGRHWILEVNKSPEIQTGFEADYKTKLLANYISRRLA